MLSAATANCPRTAPCRAVSRATLNHHAMAALPVFFTPVRETT
jgi:hypothetical protein